MDPSFISGRPLIGCPAAFWYALTSFHRAIQYNNVGCCRKFIIQAVVISEFMHKLQGVRVSGICTAAKTRKNVSARDDRHFGICPNAEARRRGLQHRSVAINQL